MNTESEKSLTIYGLHYGALVFILFCAVLCIAVYVALLCYYIGKVAYACH